MSKSLHRRVAGIGAAFALGLGALAGAPALASAQSAGCTSPCGGTGSLGSLGLGLGSGELATGAASTDMALASSRAILQLTGSAGSQCCVYEDE